MSNTKRKRIDEVDKYYKPAATVGFVSTLLFWSIAFLSLLMPFSTSLVAVLRQNVLQIAFILLTIVHFILSQVLRFYLVPRAERMRRKQLLSDSFGAPLSYDHTSLYYNNNYSPSVQRLGANTMENALFSKEIAAAMLVNKRIIISGYFIVWIFAFALRHNNLEILIWITQFVFSGEILTQWIKLEVLRFRHERTFEQLHTHFLHSIGEKSPRAIANVLDAFVEYESAKSSAGVLLSTRIFQKINPVLSKKWEQIRQELEMDFEQGAAPDRYSAGAP